MSDNISYDPVKETEFLIRNDIFAAEEQGVLKQLVSTYDDYSGNVLTGMGKKGPRILTFAPLLRLGEIRLPDLIINLLKVSEELTENPVEIEFALTIRNNNVHRFGFLQVRPMNISNEKVIVSDEDMFAEDNLCSTTTILGNGTNENITDIIFLKNAVFNPSTAYQIASEIEVLNNQYRDKQQKYALFGFGRWGTSDVWAGIPVTFGQVSRAGVIVEVAVEGMNSELSQGSHFFHNLMAFQVLYFSIPFTGRYSVDWEWLNSITPVYETEHIAQVSLDHPLTIKVDGESGKGFIKRNL
jgi:hypothetical protein